MRRTWVVIALGTALVLAACGDDGAETTDAADTADATATTEATETADATETTEATEAGTDGDMATAVTLDTSDTDLGTILVDGDGRTLYLFDNDAEGESACTDACAETWPPLEGEAEAAGDVDPALLGTITRPDGATQATYGGHPLYHYAADSAVGDVNGQAVGDVWWVVATDGSAIRDAATSSADTPAY